MTVSCNTMTCSVAQQSFFSLSCSPQVLLFQNGVVVTAVVALRNTS
jgi:cytosine/uracil/thiamine/allantoin permease